jgi:hypothetical protein
MTATDGVSAGDREILRRLAGALAAAAADPVNEARARQWRALNDRQPERAMVWINEVPWHEMDVDGELALQCEGAWARKLEGEWRRTAYQWRHFQGDMVVSPFVACPLAVHTTRVVPDEVVDVVRTDAASAVVSRHFHAQIRDLSDLSLIRDPEVTVDRDVTEASRELLSGIVDGVMPVRVTGIKGHWFTPWDYLIRLWGVEAAMMDLIERPEMVNAFVSRYVEASLRMLDQWEALGVLDRNDDNTRVGSGGYGYVTGLSDSSGGAVRSDGFVGRSARQLWGCSNAQIFSEVSPDMHWEFALKHDVPWFARWGLGYYGCCEPLDRKLDILRRIPNLRKISMSPWAKLDRAAEQTRGDYVLSFKPSPAIFATDDWQPEEARQVLRRALDQARGCPLEIIMKDISTVRYQPRRLWEWAAIAMEEVER